MPSKVISKSDKKCNAMLRWGLHTFKIKLEIKLQILLAVVTVFKLLDN